MVDGDELYNAVVGADSIVERARARLGALQTFEPLMTPQEQEFFRGAQVHFEMHASLTPQVFHALGELYYRLSNRSHHASRSREP